MLHRPVLLKEVLGLWHTKKGGFYIDGTAGAGGHARALLEHDPAARCLAIDRDPDAVRIAQEELKGFGDRITVMNRNYAELTQVLAERNLPPADGLLVDLGASSMQFDRADRGFSFRNPGPLDMRMGKSGMTALDLIRRSSPDELADLLKTYGEEPLARPIAQALKRASDRGELERTDQAAEIVRRVVLAKRKGYKESGTGGSVHPATKTFQALRIAVNQELEMLDRFLGQVPMLVEKGGHAVFISFHSLEDRRVKTAIRDWSRACVCPADFPKCVCGKKTLLRSLTPRAIQPGEEEIQANPRSRSARLRAAERC